MPMTLYFKRAKSFVSPSDNDKGTRKFLAQPGPAPQPVPFWVAETETFKRGIADESIVNLTPPAQMPGYKAPAAAEPQVEEPEPETANVAEVVDEEQKEVPQAAFGGQPMTPVPPAPKIGGIKANSKK